MIRFSRYIWVYFLISAFVLVPGLFMLFTKGLRQSIDFSGGILLELRVPESVGEKLLTDKAGETGISLSSVTKSGIGTYILRFKSENDDRVEPFLRKIGQAAAGKLTIERRETVGPVLGQELLQKSTVAAVLAVLAILFYVAYAFKNMKYGVSAIVALVHDLLVVLGLFALFGVWWQVEVDTLFVTAFLTTMSFSVHDTIVVFDRIREYTRRGSRFEFAETADLALTETMGRSLTNSLTIVFMLLALILLGGESIRWFIVALLVGTVSGTYSSPFIATPVLILWDRWEKHRRTRK